MKFATASSLCFGLLNVAAALADEPAEKPVPADTCIVELSLPPGTTITVDGRDYGAKRTLTYERLRLGSVTRIVANFPNGRSEERRVTLIPGRRVTVLVGPPNSNRPELLVQTRNSGSVKALSKDGRYLAMENQNSVSVWDVRSGHRLRSFTLEALEVEKIYFSPDNRFVCATFQKPFDSANRGTTSVWEIESGRHIAEFEGREASFGTNSQSLSVWVVNDSKRAAEAKQYDGTLEKVTWEVVADRIPRVLEQKTYKLMGREKGQVRFSSDTKYIAIYENEWETKDGKTVISSISSRIIVWNLETNKRIRTFSGLSTYFYEDNPQFALSPDSRRMAMAFHEGEVDGAKIYDLVSGDERFTLNHSVENRKRNRDDQVGLVKFSPDGRYLVTHSVNQGAALWNVADGQRVWACPLEPLVGWQIVFSPDGRRLFIVGSPRQQASPSAFILDAVTGHIQHGFTKPQTENWSLAFVAFSPGGQQIFINDTLRGAIERLSRNQGVFTIAAASATEEAQESKELGHGVLSYALLAGLKGVTSGPLDGKWAQTSNQDRVVDVLEWFTFAAGQVPRLTERLYGAAQDVQTSTQGNSFPVLPLDE